MSKSKKSIDIEIVVPEEIVAEYAVRVAFSYSNKQYRINDMFYATNGNSILKDKINRWIDMGLIVQVG